MNLATIEPPPMPRFPILKPALALLTAAALVGCGNVVRDKETAAKAMDQFHARYNAGEYDKIYDTAGTDFQDSNIRTDFLKRLDAAHRQLGPYKTCDSQGWKTNSLGGDTRVELRYRTTFANGQADEEFVYGVSGTRATLRRYRIQSDVLTTR